MVKLSSTKSLHSTDHPLTAAKLDSLLTLDRRIDTNDTLVRMMAKSVLITGCSQGGIGFALAKSFQRQGFHVFASARSVSSMSPLEALPDVTLLTIDVTSPSSIAAAVKAIDVKTGGHLDCLVNNAGCYFTMPALDVDITEARKVFDVNFWGVIEMIKACAPLLMASKGSIVNISSVAGYISTPWISIVPIPATQSPHHQMC